MSFDMGRAWNDAMGMIKANKDVLAIVAGVFFFLPSLTLSVFAPGTELEAAASDPDRMQAALMAYFSHSAPWFILSILATMVGSLALYALLGRPHKPTVAEAIKIGFVAFLPYLAATLIMGIAAFALVLLVGVIAGVTGSTAIGVVLGIILAGALVFASLRLVLVGAVIAIEEVSNPITAIARSWNLIKGNTRYVFAFLLLVGIALVVVAIVLGMIFGVFAAIFGAGAALWVEAVLGGLLGATFSTIMLAVYASIHQQLTGGVSQGDVETFE